MNANHARPMLAFWLLAAVAAMITSLGLHESGPSVTVRSGSPSPVNPNGSSELVLGDVLYAAPAPGATASLPGASLPAVSLGDPSGPSVWAGNVRAPAVAPKPRPVAKSSNTTHARATRTPTPTATAVTPAQARPSHGHHAGTGGPGKGHASLARDHAGPTSTHFVAKTSHAGPGKSGLGHGHALGHPGRGAGHR